MKAAPTFAILLGLALTLAACERKQPAPPPPAATAPPLPPSSMTHAPTLPPVPQPDTPRVGPPGAEKVAVEPEPPPPPRHTRHSKKHLATTDSTQAAASPSLSSSNPAGAAAPPAAQAPAGGPPSAPEPSLGQLSAGTGTGSKELAAMTEEIHVQETRLSNIKHPLSTDAEAVALQVRAFLTKARQAASDNDLDGARTLTTKAKLLLDELSSS